MLRCFMLCCAVVSRQGLGRQLALDGTFQVTSIAYYMAIACLVGIFAFQLSVLLICVLDLS